MTNKQLLRQLLTVTCEHLGVGYCCRQKLVRKSDDPLVVAIAKRSLLSAILP